LNKEVAVDEMFDSTVIKSQGGINNDLNDAFGGRQEIPQPSGIQ